MCGIAGFIAFERGNARPERQAVAFEMGERLKHRGPDGAGQWACPHGALAHRRSSVVDPERGRQPMVRRRGRHEYAVACDGELYNAPDLRRELEKKGWKFETACDAEVLLLSYMEWGEACVHRLEGVYALAIWDGIRERFFLCRDRLGAKPLFCARASDGALLFGSEIKALFAYPGFGPRIDEAGWCEVLGIGPARTAGCGVFAGVSELKPGHCMRVSRSSARSWRYWRLENHPHRESYADTVAHTRELLLDAIGRRLIGGELPCILLSGALDSGVLAAVAARESARRGGPPLAAYSFHCADGARGARMDADGPWTARLAEALHIRHGALACPVSELCACLEPAMEARDLPGMADADAFLLWCCRQLAQRHAVALSGMCADEVFGGYPGFEGREVPPGDASSWSADLDARREFFDKALWRRLGVEDYLRSRREAVAADVPRLDGEGAEDARRREAAWLNLNRAMAMLLERGDRMSMASGLELRMPFCDHRLVEYVWNVPWEMKARGGVRLQLLRDVARSVLPENLRTEPKNPRPGIHNSEYEALVRGRAGALLADGDAPVRQLVDAEVLRAGLNRSVGDDRCSRFVQMLAYLIQLDAWMKKYRLSL